MRGRYVTRLAMEGMFWTGTGHYIFRVPAEISRDGILDKVFNRANALIYVRFDMANIIPGEISKPLHY